MSIRELTSAELPAFVDVELRRAAGPSWRIERRSEAEWEIRPPSDGGPGQPYYAVVALGGYVVVTHGNSDAGALHLDKILERATRIDARRDPIVPGHRLGEALRRVFETCPPNRMGLT